MTSRKNSSSASAPSSTDSSPTTEATATALTPARKIRYAVIGLGHIAQIAVLPGFEHAENSELVALVSGDKKKLTKLKKKYPTAAIYNYDQLDECLADEQIEAVYVALPNDLHLNCVLRAVAAGKHVLCEKPLAPTAKEAREMVGAAAHHGVKLMTAYRLHFEPATLATVEAVRSGKIGEVRYFNSTFSYQVTDPDNIRLKLDRAGGPVYDIGTYCINAARMLMQDEPIAVSAFLARSDDKRFDEVEETASVLLRFPRGRLAAFVVSFGAATASRFELVGTKGRIVLDPAYEYSEALTQTITVEEKPEEKTFPHTDQFGGEIEAFSACILEDREPEPSGEEGVADARIIDAIFASAERGEVVRLKPFEKAQTRPPEPKKQNKKKPAAKTPELVNVDAPHSD